jgi:hypothetical protein
MLEQYMKKLCEEWQIPENKLATQVPGCYAIPMDVGLKIMATRTQSGGYMLKCSLASYPSTNGEAFATNAMLANLFGQGTQGATLGLTMDGKTVTLTRSIDYQVDYKEFREILEDFITSMDFWRAEATKK